MCTNKGLGLWILAGLSGYGTGCGPAKQTGNSLETILPDQSGNGVISSGGGVSFGIGFGLDIGSLTIVKYEYINNTRRPLRAWEIPDEYEPRLFSPNR